MSMHRLITSDWGDVFKWGETVPSATTGYAPGCLFIDTDASQGSHLWVNEGTVLVSDFNGIPTLEGDNTFTGTNTFEGTYAITGSVTIGEDGDGDDLKVFGDTASNYLLYDADTNKLYLYGTAGHLHVGTFASLLQGSGVKLTSTHTGAVKIYADDGGASIASSVRGLLSRTLLTVDQTGSSIRAAMGQLKLATGVDVQSGIYTGLQGYVELAGTHSAKTGSTFSCIDASAEITTALTVDSGGEFFGIHVETTGAGTITNNGTCAAIGITKASGAASWPVGLSVGTSIATTGISIGTCTTGVTIGDTTTAVAVTGTATDGILISGACTDGIHLSGTNTATGIHISGDQVDGILLDVDEDWASGVTISCDTTKTTTAGLEMSGAGTFTTGILLSATAITTGITLSAGSMTDAILISGTTPTDGIHISSVCGTAAINISGAEAVALSINTSTPTDGVLISANCADALHISGINTANAINISGAQTTGAGIAITSTGTLTGTLKGIAIDYDGVTLGTQSNTGIEVLMHATYGGTGTEYAIYASGDGTTVAVCSDAAAAITVGGTVTTGLAIGAATTAISLSGAATTGIAIANTSLDDGILISGTTPVDGIHISSACSANAINIGACAGHGVSVSGTFTTASSRSFKSDMTVNNPNYGDGYSANEFQLNLTGTAAGHVAAGGMWVNVNSGTHGAGGNFICAQTNGVYEVGAATITGATVIFGMRMAHQCTDTDAAGYFPFSIVSAAGLNTTTALFHTNAAAINMGAVTNAGSDDGVLVPLYQEGGSNIGYVKIYSLA